MTDAERQEELSKARWGGPSLCVNCGQALAVQPPPAGYGDRYLSWCRPCWTHDSDERMRMQAPFGKPQYLGDRSEEEPDNDRNLGLADDFEHQANAFNAERAAQEEGK